MSGVPFGASPHPALRNSMSRTPASVNPHLAHPHRRAALERQQVLRPRQPQQLLLQGGAEAHGVVRRVEGDDEGIALRGKRAVGRQGLVRAWTRTAWAGGGYEWALGQGRAGRAKGASAERARPTSRLPLLEHA